MGGPSDLFRNVAFVPDCPTIPMPLCLGPLNNQRPRYSTFPITIMLVIRLLVGPVFLLGLVWDNIVQEIIFKIPQMRRITLMHLCRVGSAAGSRELQRTRQVSRILMNGQRTPTTKRRGRFQRRRILGAAAGVTEEGEVVVVEEVEEEVAHIHPRRSRPHHLHLPLEIVGSLVGHLSVLHCLLYLLEARAL